MQLQKLISAKCLVYITLFWIMSQSPVFAQVSGVVNLGNVISFENISNGLVLKTESGVCQVSFINKNMVRVRATRTLFEKDFSYAVIEQAKTNITVNITDKKDFFEILSDSLNLTIYKNPFRISFMTKDGIVINEDEKNLGTSWVGNEVTTYKKMQDGERFIGQVKKQVRWIDEEMDTRIGTPTILVIKQMPILCMFLFLFISDCTTNRLTVYFSIIRLKAILILALLMIDFHLLQQMMEK